MSLRRFVYLVTDDAKSRDYFLRRIDMSRFFFPKGGKRDPPPLLDGCLPPAAVKFEPPANDLCDERMQFMLFGGRRNRVLATSSCGRSMLYDPESRSICSLPSFTAPKVAPISLTVGDDLFVLDNDSLFRNGRANCFDCLSRGVDWCFHTLPPPPYAHAYTRISYSGMHHVDSYAAVGDSNIWISKKSLGTYSFDTASRVWTKAGDWDLPISGHAHYVAEHGLWFGLLPMDRDSNEGMGALDLTGTPPTMRTLWKDVTPPDWMSKSSYLVHLGRSRFCYASFFKIRNHDDFNYVNFVVLTGIEVESSGDGELGVVKHKSKQYMLENKLSQCVL